MFVLAGACAPTYAPPVRTIHGGAPGHLDHGDMEIAGASSGVFWPWGMGGGTVGYAIAPSLVVTGGVDGGSEHVLGWAGVRAPFRWYLRPRISLVGEGELGLGAGVGGANRCDRSECERDDMKWYRRPAGGGYLGAGGAARFGPISIYTRARAQLTGAENVPATQWASVFGGLHGHILDRADLWVGTAYAHYSNGLDSASGIVTEIGLGFRFSPYLGWHR
jgi:hypothetical protein